MLFKLNVRVQIQYRNSKNNKPIDRNPAS